MNNPEPIFLPEKKMHTSSLRNVHIEDFSCLIANSLIHTHPGEKPCTEGEGVIGKVNRLLCMFFFFGLLQYY